MSLSPQTLSFSSLDLLCEICQLLYKDHLSHPDILPSVAFVDFGGVWFMGTHSIACNDFDHQQRHSYMNYPISTLFHEASPPTPKSTLLHTCSHHCHQIPSHRCIFWKGQEYWNCGILNSKMRLEMEVFATFFVFG